MRDSYLLRYGLTKSSNDSSQFLARNQDSFDDVKPPFGRYVHGLWSEAKRLGVDSGPLFEMIIGSVIFSAGVEAFYRKTALAKVPELELDFLLLGDDPNSPICIQLTSTLRERYKLADLQAFKIKHFYPGAYVTLLTMDSKDVARRDPAQLKSLDALIDAGSTGLDELVEVIVRKSGFKLQHSQTCSTRGSTFHASIEPHSGSLY